MTSPTEFDIGKFQFSATYALIHFFQGKERTSLEQYVRIANEILSNLREPSNGLNSQTGSSWKPRTERGHRPRSPVDRPWRVLSISVSTLHVRTTQPTLLS